jgi:hypothetical protein
VSEAIRYSIMPLYGEAAMIVIDADNLRHALESAFQCKLISVGQVHTDREEWAERNETCTMYGVISALGARDGGAYTLLCSATVITYNADESRVRCDLISLAEVNNAYT